MLQPVAVLPSRLAANVVARLKVLAELLTYRTDVPQEGRIRGAPGEIEMRLSTFPTLHGEKAVVRLFAGSGRFLRLADLGLPALVASENRSRLSPSHDSSVATHNAADTTPRASQSDAGGLGVYVLDRVLPREEFMGRAFSKGAVAPVPRISTKSGPFSPGEWLESLRWISSGLLKVRRLSW